MASEAGKKSKVTMGVVTSAPEDARRTLVADGLASVAEAGRFLSVGRSFLYELMDRGALPYSKLGRSRRIPWKALREYAANALVG
jgi:excisionase family DNA binding protein